MVELGCWALRFVRAFNDWELEEVERFLSKLQGKGLHSLEDSVVWIGAKDGRFADKCLYGKLEPRGGGGAVSLQKQGFSLGLDRGEGW